MHWHRRGEGSSAPQALKTAGIRHIRFNPHEFHVLTLYIYIYYKTTVNIVPRGPLLLTEDLCGPEEMKLVIKK